MCLVCLEPYLNVSSVSRTLPQGSLTLKGPFSGVTRGLSQGASLVKGPLTFTQI